MKKTKIYEGVVVPLSKVNLFRDADGKLHVLHCNCFGKDHWIKTDSSKNNYTFPLEFDACPGCGMHPWYFVEKMCSDDFFRKHSPIWAGTSKHKEALR
jgi:hypothetical protein